jgi:hypothetical protein
MIYVSCAYNLLLHYIRTGGLIPKTVSSAERPSRLEEVAFMFAIFGELIGFRH